MRAPARLAVGASVLVLVTSCGDDGSTMPTGTASPLPTVLSDESVGAAYAQLQRDVPSVDGMYRTLEGGRAQFVVIIPTGENPTKVSVEGFVPRISDVGLRELVQKQHTIEGIVGASSEAASVSSIGIQLPSLCVHVVFASDGTSPLAAQLREMPNVCVASDVGAVVRPG